MMLGRSQAVFVAAAAVVAACWIQPWSASAQPQGQPQGQPSSNQPPPPRGPEGREGRGGGEGRGPEGRQGGQRPQQPSVEGAMKGMNRGVKVLKGQLGEASKKEENLRTVNDMQRSCVAAKSQPVPKDVLEKTGDEKAQAKASLGYRANLIKTMRLLLDLEEAIVADNASAANAKLAEIEKLRDAAHEEIGLKEDEPLPLAPPK